MRMKMECSSCGYAELMSDRRMVHCPECGSTDIAFESDPMAEGRAIDATEEAVRASESIAVPKAAPKAVPMAPSQPIQPVPEAPETLAKTFRNSSIPRSRSGSRLSNIDSEMQVRIVFGLIGFILLMSGIGVLLGVSLVGGITLIVIGFIFLVIATKGEICCSC